MNTKIVLVEDDPLLIDIYSTKFKESGFEVAVVDRGDAAPSFIAKERPDLVVLDIVLPQKDGWDILRTVKSNEKTKDIKVVILSNLGQKEEIEKGMALGASGYLIKAHHTPSEVVREIKKILAEPQT
jgi:DNA-binding response OmpR family regulator